MHPLSDDLLYADDIKELLDAKNIKHGHFDWSNPFFLQFGGCKPIIPLWLRDRALGEIEHILDDIDVLGDEMEAEPTINSSFYYGEVNEVWIM